MNLIPQKSLYKISVFYMQWCGGNCDSILSALYPALFSLKITVELEKRVEFVNFTIS